MCLILSGVVGIFVGSIWVREAPLRDAEELLEAGDFDRAMEQLRVWEKDHAATGRSRALMARGLVAAGMHQSAIRIFETFGAANEKEIHAWANAYLSLRRWSSALPLLKDLRQRDPENVDVMHELAACQAQLGMFEAALVSAKEFQHSGTQTHRALLLVGSIHLKRGNKSAAVEAWEQIHDFDPEYQDLQIPPEEFLTQFASLQIELGQLEAAQKLLARSLAIRETAEGRFQSGLAADLTGHPDEARRSWERVIELENLHLNARESLARLEIARGDAQKATEILSPVLASGNLRSSTTYLMQRIAQLKKDEEGTAAWKEKTATLRRRETMDSTVNRILTENPNSYWSHVIRSYQFAEQGNYVQAQQILDHLNDPNEHQFVRQLRDAIQNRSRLPEKDELPISLF